MSTSPFLIEDVDQVLVKNSTQVTVEDSADVHIKRAKMITLHGPQDVVIYDANGNSYKLVPTVKSQQSAKELIDSMRDTDLYRQQKKDAEKYLDERKKRVVKENLESINLNLSEYSFLVQQDIFDVLIKEYSNFFIYNAEETANTKLTLDALSCAKDFAVYTRVDVNTKVTSPSWVIMLPDSHLNSTKLIMSGFV